MTRVLVSGLVFGLLFALASPAPADDPAEPLRGPPDADARPAEPAGEAPGLPSAPPWPWLAPRATPVDREPDASAIARALRWLALHQDPVGAWDADGFSAQCRLNTCGGAGYALNDVGVTALALLAFLGDGETHARGPHRENVRRGVRWLMSEQDDEGAIGTRAGRKSVYGHALATLALVEAHATTRSPLLRAAAERGIDFLLRCQNPYLAWRYGVRPADNDTSVSAFVTLALATAKRCGFAVAPSAADGMKAWLDKVTEPEFGRAGYTARGSGPSRDDDAARLWPADRTEGPTAAAVFSRVLLGEDPRKSEMIGKGAVLLGKCLPRWDGSAGTIDLAYWHWGSLAMFQVGGDAWAGWEAAVRVALLDHQRRDGDEAGSLDPAGVWGRDGGRVYSTAMLALVLETPRRYARLPPPPRR